MRGVHKFEDIYGIDLRSALRERSTASGLPIRFARDAESAGTGESLAGAGAGVDRVLTMTVGTGLGTCLTDHAQPVETVDGFGVEHLGMRDTPWGGRADDVLSAHGLALRLGIDMADLRSAVDDPANAERRPRPRHPAGYVPRTGGRRIRRPPRRDRRRVLRAPSIDSVPPCSPPSAPSPSALPHSAQPARSSVPPTSRSAPDPTRNRVPARPMSQPTAYGGFAHRDTGSRPTDEPTDRIRRFRSSRER